MQDHASPSRPSTRGPVKSHSNSPTISIHNTSLKQLQLATTLATVQEDALPPHLQVDKLRSKNTSHASRRIVRALRGRPRFFPSLWPTLASCLVESTPGKSQASSLSQSSFATKLPILDDELQERPHLRGEQRANILENHEHEPCRMAGTDLDLDKQGQLLGPQEQRLFVQHPENFRD